MKLKQNNKKSKLTILWIMLAVLVVAILAFVIVNAIIQDQNGKEIVNISMDIPPRLTYNVGEDFDPTGARLQVVTRDPKNTQFVYLPNKDVEFSGFDSSKAVDSQVVTVKYQGFTTTINVVILPKSEAPVQKELVSIRITDNLIKEYSKNDWNFFGPTLDGVFIIPVFSDGSEGDPIAISINDFDDINLNIQTAGEYTFTVSYTFATKTVKKEVTIRITE